MRSNRIASSLAAAAFSFTLIAGGCQKRVPITAPPPAPAPVVSALDQADRSFTSRSYDEAARAYENYLRDSPTGSQRDQALFRLALAYALRPGAVVDWQRTTATLKQLIDEYPNSPFRAPAVVIVSLHTELDQASADNKQRDLRIRQLATELDRLKKIDADRRKRP